MKISGSIKAISMAIIICLLGTIYCSVVLALDKKEEYTVLNSNALVGEKVQNSLEGNFKSSPEELKIDVNVERLKKIAEEEKAKEEELKRKEAEEKAKAIVYDGLTLEELSAKLNRTLSSDLTGYGHVFAEKAISLGIDPYLSVAIVMHETGCKWNCSTLLKQCNNVGGMKGSPGCNGGSYKAFATLDEGIDAYMNNLYKNYFSMGLTTPETIGPKYAASKTWANQVTAYINEIKAA